MTRVTIDDVAKKAEVSKGTVSAVINAKKSVKVETRDHILKIMKDLNFRPKGIARNLKNGAQDKSIGIIIKDINYPFYTTIVSGINEYAAKHGCDARAPGAGACASCCWGWPRPRRCWR